MAKILKFPKGFLWGTATSAYQIEGGIENNDWAKDFPAGRCCDHYNLYEKDFDLIKKLNQNAYRFSIEWSRIETKEGEFSQKEIEHYRKVLLALKERKIKVILTLHHFTNPLWLSEIGGWENPEVQFYFSRFSKRIFSEFSDLVEFWLTINEPMVYASKSYLEGSWPPKKKSFFAFLRVVKNQISSHKKVFEEFHKIKKEVRVGIAKNNFYFEPFNPNSLLDKFNAWLNRYFWNEFFLNRIKNHLDFIGFNYYMHQKIKFPAQNKNENKILSDIGWEIYPEGIYHCLKELKKYQKPIFITENGLADAKDKLRKDFIKEHLRWVHKAIEEGVEVKGYFHWSLIDNFEWEKGFEPRFGLIEVDYQTLERKPRPSAKFYAKICKENQLTLNPKP
jgi:beta-glucosidase